MITCDICNHVINTLKEAWHTIPQEKCNAVMCDSCYQGWVKFLKEHKDG